MEEFQLNFGGLFTPSHPSERTIRDGQRWDLNDLEALPAQATSWGAHLFQIRDPDEVPVTLLQ